MNLLKLYRVVVVVLVIIVCLTLLLAVQELPPYAAADNPRTSGEVYQDYVRWAPEDCRAYNLVTNILLDFRAYDTLLETTSLFTVVMGIILMWGTGREQQ